ncbi:hypothetical protein [Zooshikella ganghwensis]|uniref:hypothetical protein n=1 Tax=Zooshikella ganghwensis TaxID=202772 RepID=UPI000418B380|nr:hypothetical protein [Zooshikella ganghwensis]
MSESFFNVNGAWRSLDTAYVNVNGKWREADVYVNVNGNWNLVSLKRVTLSGGTHFDLFAHLAPLVGGAGNIEITLNGTYQGTTTAAAAFLITDTFAGRRVRIINNGLILGKEGAGGPGGPWNAAGHAGAAGGTAIYVNPSHGCRYLEFHNASGGRVYAGGGGGGGGGGAWGGLGGNSNYGVKVSGGRGGSGAGSKGVSLPATAGEAGGYQNERGFMWARGGAGGAGGNFGASGAQGGTGSSKGAPSAGAYGGGAGGAAGIAIHNVSAITLTGNTSTTHIMGRRI